MRRLAFIAAESETRAAILRQRPRRAAETGGKAAGTETGTVYGKITGAIVYGRDRNGRFLRLYSPRHYPPRDTLEAGGERRGETRAGISPDRTRETDGGRHRGRGRSTGAGILRQGGDGRRDSTRRKLAGILCRERERQAHGRHRPRERRQTGRERHRRRDRPRARRRERFPDRKEGEKVL